MLRSAISCHQIEYGGRLSDRWRPSASGSWSVPDWTERFSIDGHENIVWGLTYGPDGRSPASGSFDGTVKLWDPETGHERVTLGSHGYWVLGLEFARDGSLLATCSSDGVKLWRAD